MVPLYHHCIPASRVTCGSIRADRSLSDPEFLPAYEWVEDQLGFFPLFLAVGAFDDINRMTVTRITGGSGQGVNLLKGYTGRPTGEKENFPTLLFSHSTISKVCSWITVAGISQSMPVCMVLLSRTLRR